MKRWNIIFALLIGILAASFVVGQERPFAGSTTDVKNKRKGQIRIFRQLGLSQEQIQQIRQINKDTRPERRKAVRHLRQTKNDLDKAIYADVLDEKTVQTRLQAFLDAQTHVVRLSRMNEVAVRNVLSMEQISKFRKLRKNHAINQRRRKRQLRRRDNNRRVQRNRGTRRQIPGVRRRNR